MNKYKYYIRIDSEKNIVHAFSDGLQDAQAGDIMVGEDFERCWGIPDLMNMGQQYRYKWNGKQIIEKTPEELAAAQNTKKEADRIARANLVEIDLRSIRSIREYLVANGTPNKVLVEYEKQAIEERKNLIRDGLVTRYVGKLSALVDRVKGLFKGSE